MGILEEVAERVEAMVEPAARLSRLTVEAGITIMAGGLRFAERELRYMQRSVKKRTRSRSPKG